MQWLFSVFSAGTSADVLGVLASLQVEVCMVALALIFFRFLEGGLHKGSWMKPDRAPSTTPEAAVEEPSKIDYSSQIKACGLTGDVQLARKLWSEMVFEEGPSPAALSNMVEVLVASSASNEAWDLANAVWGHGKLYLRNNVIIYSALLRGFAKAKQHKEVVAVYDEMQERKVSMNTVTYNVVLNAITHSGLMCRVPDMLSIMQSGGQRSWPDSVTYSTIIKGSCLIGDLDAGLKLLDFVRHQTEIRLDEWAYNTLLECCARQHRARDGIWLLEQMRDEGVVPSNYTLSIAIKVLGRAHFLKQAFELVEEVGVRHGLKPNIQTVTCLMQACFQSAKVGKAFDLHNKIVTEGHLHPDQKLYTALARGCLDMKGTAKAALVVRCAFHLPGGSRLLMAEGRPQGVDSACIDAVLAALAETEPDAAAELESELAAMAAFPKRGARGKKMQIGAEPLVS